MWKQEFATRFVMDGVDPGPCAVPVLVKVTLLLWAERGGWVSGTATGLPHLPMGVGNGGAQQPLTLGESLSGGP